MGGRGQTSNGKRTLADRIPGKREGKMSENERFIEELARDLNNPESGLSNGDMQGAVEAYAMTHPNVDEDEMMEAVRKRASAIWNANVEKRVASGNINDYQVRHRMNGVSIRFQGEDTDYYFTSHKGTNYYQRGWGGRPEPTPKNMTYNEFIERAKRNGASIQRLSDVDKERKYEEYRKRRREAEKSLDLDNVQNKEMKRGSRAARKVNRANRRK